jgi:hypothetical protein
MDVSSITILVTFRFSDRSVTQYVKATPDMEGGWYFAKGVLEKQAIKLGMKPGEKFTVVPALN